jgi:iron(III) transport system substrate-binding protein
MALHTGALLLLAAATLLGSACGPAAGPPAAAPAAPARTTESAAAPAPSTVAAATPAALQQLIERARAEGELNLVLSPTFFRGGEALPEIERAFNSHYGLNTTIQRTVGPTMPQVAATIAQEVQAGRKPQTDLFMGSPFQLATLLRAEALEAVDWQALDSRLPALAVAEGNAGVAYISSYSGMTYNQQLIPAGEVPRTLESLLEPKWKGKIASTPYAAGFAPLARATAWGEQRTVDYLGKLRDQLGGLIRCNEYERLLSGEFVLYGLNCGVASDQVAHRDGMPIAFSIPADAPQVGYYAWGVPKGSAHPATATLFVLFLVSEPGQRLSYSADFADLHLLPGSQSIALVKPLLDQGVRLMGEDEMLKLSGDAVESGRLEKVIQDLLARP